jgi:hypothetical protein
LGISLAAGISEIIFMVQLGGAFMEHPPRPIFGSVSLLEGNIPKGSNILRFEEGFKKSHAKYSIEQGIPHYGVFPNSNLLSIVWNPSEGKRE